MKLSSTGSQPRLVARQRLHFGVTTAIAILAGGVLTVALLAYYGFGGVGAQIAAVGWRNIVLIAAIQAVVLAVAGLAWWLLMRRPVSSLLPVVGARLIREAGSELLPFSALGGYLMSARALAVQGIWGPRAMASLIVDVTLEVAAQIAFAVVALALLAQYDFRSPIIGPVAIGLAIACAAVGATYAFQRRKIGLFERIGKPMAGNFFGRQFGRGVAVQRHVNAIYNESWRVHASFLLHFACWIASAAEIWLALNFMGRTIDFTSVLAIEGLASAVCGAAFFVPNAIGIQEGAFVALGAVFGLDPESALALSLLKRARDLAVGLPSLLLLQGLEAHGLW
ncbi:MAG: lysylphosphatidylglycerol synthase domain-containing protein, partial [Stellaceae bacterium]